MSRILLAFASFVIFVAGCNPPPSSTVDTPKPEGQSEAPPKVQIGGQPEQKPNTDPKPVKEEESVTAAEKAEKSPLFHWANTLQDGQALAKKQNGFTLAKFETSWCAPCRVMKLEAFQDEKIAKLLSKAVIVPIDGDSQEGQVLMDKYKVDTYPTLVFIKPDGTVFGTIIGYMNVDWLDREVKRVFERAKYPG